MDKNIINNVFELCNNFIVDGKGRYVGLSEAGMKSVVPDIKEWLGEKKDSWLGYPKCLDSEEENNLDYKLLCYELIAGSINYQYWYGRSDVRHNGACAYRMYELLDESFNMASEQIKKFNPSFYAMTSVGTAEAVSVKAIDNFIELLSVERFPNIENRVRHLKEVSRFIMERRIDGETIINNLVGRIVKNELSVNEFLEILISNLPGYAEDLFLKRAFLVVLMLYRRMEWFKNEIHLLPMPADYQVPKMLEGLRCIDYSPSLSDKIDHGDIIPSGSLEECEIRAATILAGQKLAELSGFTMCDMDTYFWLKRKEIETPFHLTITTNY